MADDNTIASQAATCLETMTGALGIVTKAQGTGDGKKIILKVETDEPGRLIGRGGRVLNNFDYLLNRIISGKTDASPRVVIDVEGSKNERKASRPSKEAAPSDESQAERPKPRREGEDERPKPRREGEDVRPKPRREGEDERLQRLALDAAKEVKRWGDPKTIGPFNPGERRVIHAALQGDSAIQVESGEELQGNRKKMKISLVSDK